MPTRAEKTASRTRAQPAWREEIETRSAARGENMLMQRLSRQHIRHRNEQDWNRQRRTNPKSPRHVYQARDSSPPSTSTVRGFQRHAALRTRTRRIADDFRMHRTGIFSLGQRRADVERLQRHAALRTCARARAGAPRGPWDKCRSPLGNSGLASTCACELDALGCRRRRNFAAP